MVSSWKATDIVMKPSEHKKLACHAVGLNHATLDEVEVCTDPKKHKTVKQAQESEEQKRRKAREKAEAAQAAMEEGRHSFAAQFVQGKVSENDLLQLLAIRLGQSAHRTLEFACELLGVTQEEVDAIADDVPGRLRGRAGGRARAADGEVQGRERPHPDRDPARAGGGVDLRHAAGGLPRLPQEQGLQALQGRAGASSTSGRRSASTSRSRSPRRRRPSRRRRSRR